MEHVRVATSDDGPRLIELAGLAYEEVMGRRGGPALTRSVLDGRSIPDVVDSALADPRTLVVAGELQGFVLGVGVAQVRRAHDSLATVEVLYVEPAARAIGLGEAILGAIIDWAKAMGCDGIDATALPGSREAKAFFETHGLVTRALVMYRSLEGRPAQVDGDGR